MWPFGKKVPEAPIHADDKDLVRPEDIRWYSSLSMKSANLLIKEDNVCKAATYLKSLKEGLTREEAGEKCRKYFPYYYKSLEQRSDHKWQGEDAPLPFHIKDRVNRAASTFNKEAVDLSSTMNAYIRALIRKGAM